MSEQKETPTITMTEEQLERVIKTAVKNALYEMKNEENELPGLQEDELADAVTTFTILKIVLALLFGGVGLFSALLVAATFNQMTKNGFSWDYVIALIDFVGVTVTIIVAIVEIIKTKKLEVLNTVFSAIMALASLIVAIVGAVFAYKAL